MSKDTVFMPSIIIGLFSLSTCSCYLAYSTSSLSTSMFLLLLSESLFVEIAMNSFLIMLLEILRASLHGLSNHPFNVGFVTFVTFVLLFRLDINICNFISCLLKRSWFLNHRFMLLMAGLELFICLRTPIS